MAFFGITDLKFKTMEKRGAKNTGISALVTSLMYPLNLGSSERGHYIIFHINEYGEASGKDAQTTAQKNADILAMSGKNNRATAGNVAGATNYLVSKVPLVSENTKTAISNSVNRASNKILNPSQRYKRTAKSLALYMPNTLQYDYTHSYNSVSATSALGKVGFIAQGAESVMSKDVNNMSSFAGEALTGLASKIGIISDAAGQMTMQGAFDTAINPQVELLYSNPELRTFDFSFVFYPETRDEAVAIDEIISTFKHTAAPEIKSNSSGRYFTPPGTFDIEFMYNGAQNKNIPKISTCALESIQVNYAPDGFSAIEVNPGEDYMGEKGDGMPSHITLNLRFREMEIITKELLDDFNFPDGNTF